LDPGQVLTIQYPFFGKVKYDVTKDYQQITIPLFMPTIRLGMTAGFSL